MQDAARCNQSCDLTVGLMGLGFVLIGSLSGMIDLSGGVVVSVLSSGLVGLSVCSGIGVRTSLSGVPWGGMRSVNGRKSRSPASALLATGTSIIAELKLDTQIMSPESAR